jgi:hypothetical protein
MSVRSHLQRVDVDRLRMTSRQGPIRLEGNGTLWPRTRWGWDTGIVILPRAFMDALRAIQSNWAGIAVIRGGGVAGLPPGGEYELVWVRAEGGQVLGSAFLRWFQAATDAVALVEGRGNLPPGMAVGEPGQHALLPRWKLLELGALAVEMELAGRDPAPGITFDDRIADRETGDLRQVDVAVRYQLAGREFLRTIEATAEEIGSEAVDEAEGKARRIGAHRTTLLTATGFTEPARRRLERNAALLDGVHLRDPREEEWPIRWPYPALHIGSEATGIETRTELQPLAYADALTDRAELLLLVGDVDAPDLAGAAVAVLRAAGTAPVGTPVPIALRILQRGTPPVEADGLRLDWGTRSAVGKPLLEKATLYWVRRAQPS